MSVDRVTFAKIPIAKPRNPKMGRPRAPLPIGLNDGEILRIRRKAEKPCFSNVNASFAAVYAALVFGALAQAGKARLDPHECMALAKLVCTDMPSELSVIIASFLASHPVGQDFAGMQRAIRAGQIGGERGLLALWHHIRDAARKRAAKRAAKMTPPSPSRPRLLSKAERAARFAEAEAKRIEAETKQANEALAKLYNRRFAAESITPIKALARV